MNKTRKGILADPNATLDEIDQAMGEAVMDAVRQHKLAGVPIAVWEGDWEHGKVVIIPPERIELPEHPIPTNGVASGESQSGEQKP